MGWEHHPLALSPMSATAAEAFLDILRQSNLLTGEQFERVRGVCARDLPAETVDVQETVLLPATMGRVTDTCFTPDGRHLITAHENGTLYVLRLEAWRRGVGVE